VPDLAWNPSGDPPRWRVPSAVPLVDEGDVEAVAAVLRSGALANGPHGAALESEFAAYCAVPHAVAVSSGTAALVLAGQAMGLRPGAPVLVAGFTFAASANAFLRLGCRVVPVDVDLDTMNIDPVDLAAAFEEWPGAAAVVVVDLFGSTRGTDEAIELAHDAGVPVVEDAAQAHGARTRAGVRVGGRADITTFSLYATKNMTAGEGGLLTTTSGELGESVRRLRNHGALTTYCHEAVGLNHRLPEMAAVLARRQLARLDDATATRRRQARDLGTWCRSAWGSDAVVPAEAWEVSSGHVFHQFTVRFGSAERRDAVAAQLREHGVDARHFYPYAVRDLPGVVRRPTPRAEHLRDSVLSLPVHPGLDRRQWRHLREAVLATRLRRPA
jgi:perosamine synthetase